MYVLTFDSFYFDFSDTNYVKLYLDFSTHNGFKIDNSYDLHFYISIYNQSNTGSEIFVDPNNINVLSGPGIIFRTPQYERGDVPHYFDSSITQNYGIINIEELGINTQYSIELLYNKTDFTINNTYKATLTTQSGTAIAIETNDAFNCLFEDIEVLTPSGYVSVKSLQKGDLVTTSDGRFSPIKRILSSYMPKQEKFLPIIIPANSITENYPPKDCRLSKYHLINFNGKWIIPYKNEHIFKYDRDVKSIKYYHLELENYFTDHLVINGGLVVESLTNGKEDTGIEWDTRVKNSIIL